MHATPDARLMFLISDDYGELGNVMYILKGQKFTDHTTLLLSPRIYATHGDTLPGQIRKYRGLQDIVDAVDDRKPDIVFLFSGYLYTINSVLSQECVEKLIPLLRKKVPHVVTSDFFLGGLSEAHIAAKLARIHPPFLKAFELLRDITHFYPVPCHRLARSRETPTVFAFNPVFLRSDGATVSEAILSFYREIGVDATKPFWLFILSQRDYEIQVRRSGDVPFAEVLLSKLDETLKAGRQAVFLGPPDCLQAISSETRSAAGAVLLDFCPYDSFTSLLLGAEYVFYWNMFSISNIIRLGNGLPLFFFDTGNLCEIGAMYEILAQNYLQGWKPVCLDHRQELLPPILDIVNTVFRRDLQRVGECFRSLPSPDKMVASILNT